MDEITSYGPDLANRLKKYIRSRKADMESSGEWGTDFLERFERFSVGGKLLRGCLLCYGYEAFSGRAPDEGVMSAAMALELAHGGLLIHDDIMDGDELRRGRPSMHEQYRVAAERRHLAGAAQFGAGVAMSGGDSALLMAFDLLGNAQAAHPESQIHKLFADQLLRTCAGQMQDVYLASLPDIPSKRTIYHLMRTKTASYTIALPLMMGASLAGQPPAVIRRLLSIGLVGGTIFQIRDDELGVFGDPEQTGKPVGADIKEGKKTLLYYYLMKRCSAAERRTIAAVFGNQDATGDEIGTVRRLARRRRVPGLLAAEVKRSRTSAYADIARLPLDRSAKRELRGLIGFCAKRQF